MSKNTNESKRFLLPILTLALTSILLVSITTSYVSIDIYKQHINEQISTIKNEYEEKNKEIVYNEVMSVQKTIQYEMLTIEVKLKNILKERVETAIRISNFIYNSHKETHTKDELKEKIANALSNIKFNSDQDYYFIYDNKTKLILSHQIKKLIGTDIRNIKDFQGNILIKDDEKMLSQNDFGFKKFYFMKPNDEKNLYPKINCIAKFEELDLIIGTGEYLDVIEEESKKHILEMFSKNTFNENNKYITILKIDNLDGGDDFATVLVNSNRKDLVGKKVSDKSKDIEGNRFRKDFLNIAKNKGEGFSQYWYKNPETNKASLKMSYIYFLKDWNWLILSGFYYEDMEKQIQKIKDSMLLHTNSTIYQTLLWDIFLSFLAILIASYVSYRIDGTIRIYTNTIKDYEEKKRKQDNMIQQQSKMAAMGEMLGNIAHQWRQPLSMISTLSTGAKIQSEIGCLSKEDLTSTFNKINDSAQYLSKTIDDFRSFFNPNNSKVSDFNISETFDKTLNILSAQFKSKEIKIIMDVEVIQLTSIENSLIQVLINILNNSRDALESTINQKKLIFISTKKSKECIVISIKDNAKGISEDIIDRIFEPYFTTKHQSQGTGIGLYMSEEIVRVHLNGSILVSNESYEYENVNYKGANFIINIPIKISNSICT